MGTIRGITVTSVAKFTPTSPNVIVDDTANTITATHTLGSSEILISINNGLYTQFDGVTINVGDINLPAGYYKFKIKATLSRSESSVVASPAFTVSSGTGVNTSYTLSDNMFATSAGVFKTDGTLIRTLWGVKKQKAGTYPIYWDGKDDDGNVASTDTYHVEVLKNKVVYNWDGVIGNTSTINVGTEYDVMRSFTGIHDMDIVGTKIFYCVGYNETTAATYTKDTTNINGGASPVRPTFAFAEYITQYCTSDGTNVYWGGYDPHAVTTSWLWASKVTDNTEVLFSSGTAIQQAYPGYKYPSGIDFRTENPVQVKHSLTGLTVQKNGSYLFCARGPQGIVSVINKTTGALVLTLSIANVTAICADTASGLWIATENSINKYTVAANGSIGTPTLTISTGLSRITYMKVSPDGATLAIIDAGANQQVKGFNNTTGAANWTLGTQGGYLTNSTVTKTKFHFGSWPIVADNGNTDLTEQIFPFIAFQPDGAMWVGDIGNNRYMRFTTAQIYQDEFGMLNATYTTNVHPSDATRVFANGTYGELEFAIDYTKTLDNGLNGSWTLKRNWGASLSAYYEKTYSFRNIFQLPNGKTYTTIHNVINNNDEVFELVPNGILRNTGVIIGTSTVKVIADGSLIIARDVTDGQPYIWRKAALIDTLNDNPNWGAVSPITFDSLSNNIISIIKDSTKDPYNATNSDMGAITTTNKLISYYGDVNTKVHLGGIKLTAGGVASSFLWKAAKSTRASYQGEFPTNGDFDTGNSVAAGHAGGDMHVFNGNNILWNYHGEFWKGGQTNYYAHFYENGLAVGFFGKFSNESALKIDSGLAGNVQNFGIGDVDVTSSYLYHPDEGVHCAVHRWSMKGLDTIQVNSFDYISGNEPDTLPGIDLMAGLLPTYPSGGDILVDGIAAWNRLPLANNSPSTADYWRVTFGQRTYLKNKPVDLLIEFNKPADYTNYPPTIPTQSAYVTRDLSNDIKNGISYNTTGLTTWKLSGSVQWDTQINFNVGTNNGTNTGDGGGQFMEVLDSTGKVITRLYPRNITGTTITSLMANDTAIVTMDNVNLAFSKYVTKLRNFSIFVNSTGASYAYSDFGIVSTGIVDTTSNWQNPKTLRFYFWTWNNDKNRLIGVQDLRFEANAISI